VQGSEQRASCAGDGGERISKRRGDVAHGSGRAVHLVIRYKHGEKRERAVAAAAEKE
jgi:hypothetical protein